MGIDSFNKFIKDKVPGALTEIPLQHFSGSTMSVDLFGLLFKMRPGAVKSVDKLIDLSTGEINHADINVKCTELVLKRLILYMKHDINLVICLDSKHHKLREKVRERRNNQRKKNTSEFNLLKSQLLKMDPLFRNNIATKMKNIYQNMVDTQDGYINGLVDLLKTVGFIVVSPSDFYPKGSTGDGEALCATLCMNNICNVGIVTDGDFHLYGGSFSIIDLNEKWVTENGFNKKIHIATIRSLPQIMEKEDITFDQFQQICILSGIDYNDGVKGIAFATSFKHIKKHGDIRNFAVFNYNESVKKKVEPIDWTLINYDEVKQVIDSAMVELPNRNWNFNVTNFNKFAKNSLILEGLPDVYNLLYDTPVVQKLLQTMNVSSTI